jgi:hypothetical protein
MKQWKRQDFNLHEKVARVAAKITNIVFNRETL